MKNKKFAVPTRISFSVELTVNQFLTVEKRDETLEKRIDKTFPHNRDAAGLFAFLPEITNAYDLEYNGHFGAAVYFTMDAEKAHEAEIVAEVIKLYAQKAPYSKIIETAQKSDGSYSRGYSYFKHLFA